MADTKSPLQMDDTPNPGGIDDDDRPSPFNQAGLLN